MTGPSTAPDSSGSGDDLPLAAVSSTRARRVVLGLAVVLVVLVGGGAAVLAISTGAGRDGDGPPAAGPGTGPSAGPAAGRSASSGVSPGVSAPPAGAPSAGGTPGGTPAGGSLSPTPPDDAFRAVPGLCEEADFSPVFDILAQVGVLVDDEVTGPTLYQRSCTFRLEDAGSMGTFRVGVSVYSSPSEAQGWFEDILAAEARGEPHRELVGDWDANAVLAVAVGRDQAEVRFLGRDETLLLNLSTFILGDAAAEQAQQAAVVAIAEQLRDGMQA